MIPGPSFDFHAPPRVVFGRGRLAELPALAAPLGRRALVVTGARWARASGLLEEVRRLLAGAGVKAYHAAVSGEPEVAAVDAAAAAARSLGCELVVGLGGGSALDAAKAAAVLATNGGSALDYLEVVGAGRRLQRPGLPVIAIPTTAGTGAEATRNAVLGHPPSGRKASLRHPYLLPRVALVDPALTDTLPREVTAAAGLDALTQLLESYLSRRAHPLTDALALDGLRRVAHALPRACGLEHDPGGAGHPQPDPRDLAAARDDLALAALESGLCLGSAGLGIVHGLSGPLGGRFPVPHGLACAALLPHAFRVNARALLRADPEAPAARRLVTLAGALLQPAPGAAGPVAPPATPGGAAALVEAWLRDLTERLAVPRLSAFGVRAEDVPALARAGLASSSTACNPVPLTPEEVEEILAAAL